MTRNEARVIMMQILYELQAAGEWDRDAVESLCQQRLSGNHVQRGTELLGSITDDLQEIDQQIDRCSSRWKTSRMARVDLAILRLAIGEMRYASDISQAVTINEAIDLGKKYSTENSSRFIHGVLGAAAREYA